MLLSTIAGTAFFLLQQMRPNTHTGISLVMQHGPVHKQSLADLYKGKVPKPLKKSLVLSSRVRGQGSNLTRERTKNLLVQQENKQKPGCPHGGSGIPA